MALKKPSLGQAIQAAAFLFCAALALRITSGVDGTEFSGGWLTGPLLSMTEIGIDLFVVALVLTILIPRVAAVIGLLSSALCLPLYCFFIAPVPFAQVFAPGHEFKVQPAAGIHWHPWPVAASLVAIITVYVCSRRLAVRGAAQAK